MAISATKVTRSFRITDEGDAFDLSMFEGDRQVGGGLFPIEPLGVDCAYDLAISMAHLFMAR